MEYRIYARKNNPLTCKRRNLGTFKTMDKTNNHDQQIELILNLNNNS